MSFLTRLSSFLSRGTPDTSVAPPPPPVEPVDAALAKVLPLLREGEGLRLEAYPDPLAPDGLPVTIGYGTTLIDGKPIKLGMKITLEQAERYLLEDVKVRMAAIKKMVTISLLDCELAALTSLSYNIGLGAFKNSTLLKRLNAGQTSLASAEFPKWNMAKGKVSNGLTKRRKIERDVFDGKV